MTHVNLWKVVAECRYRYDAALGAFVSSMFSSGLTLLAIDSSDSDMPSVAQPLRYLRPRFRV